MADAFVHSVITQCVFSRKLLCEVVPQMTRTSSTHTLTRRTDILAEKYDRGRVMLVKGEHAFLVQTFQPAGPQPPLILGAIPAQGFKWPLRFPLPTPAMMGTETCWILSRSSGLCSAEVCVLH